MNRVKREKEQERYYLFAGMGGKAYRRKRNIFLAWSLVAGAIVSVVVALGFYYFNLRW